MIIFFNRGLNIFMVFITS